MESKQSSKRRLQKEASENNSLEYSRISSVSEENEKYPENCEDSATFRDYYDEYINSRNTSQSTNGNVYSSCDDQSDSDIVKDTQKLNGTETSKKGRSRKSSKSRSPRRSLSRKGSKRSSSRRNKKSKEIQRDKSPNKRDSQRRKPERTTSKNTRKSTGNNRFRSLVKTRIWVPKTHGENPNTISDSDTSSDSDSETWKDTESEISTSSVSQVEQNEEPKRMFSSENTQKQNCEAAEKRNKRIDKKVKSSSIRSKAESDVCLKSSEQLCEEDLHEKNWPGTHDENHEKYSEDENGSTNSLNSSHTYTLFRDEKSVSNLPMTETCEEIKTPRRKKESNKRKHERKRKTKDEATMTEEGLFSVGPHLTANGNPEGNNTHSNRDTSHYDSDGQPDQNGSEEQPDQDDNEAQPDNNEAQPDHHDNEAKAYHQNNETQSVSSGGSGHLERLCAKYGVGSDSSDASSDNSEDEKKQRIKTNVERNEEDTVYNYRPTAEKAEEPLTEDSTDVVNDNEELENDSNNNEKPQRKRSVTFSEAIAVTEPVTKETTEELVNDDVDKLAAELTVGFLAFVHSPYYSDVMLALALIKTHWKITYMSAFLPRLLATKTMILQISSRNSEMNSRMKYIVYIPN